MSKRESKDINSENILQLPRRQDSKVIDRNINPFEETELNIEQIETENLEYLAYLEQLEKEENERSRKKKEKRRDIKEELNSAIIVTDDDSESELTMSAKSKEELKVIAIKYEAGNEQVRKEQLQLVSGDQYEELLEQVIKITKNDEFKQQLINKLGKQNSKATPGFGQTTLVPPVRDDPYIHASAPP